MPKGFVDVGTLYSALAAQRQAEGLSWRQLAQKVGVSPSTLTRMANGNRPDLDAFAALVQWLGIPAEQFMTDEERQNREEPDLVAQMAPLLRARKDLTPKDVRELMRLLAKTKASAQKSAKARAG